MFRLLKHLNLGQISQTAWNNTIQKQLLCTTSKVEARKKRIHRQDIEPEKGWNNEEGKTDMVRNTTNLFLNFSYSIISC